MPLVGTRGAASARGFGLFGKKSTTVIFNTPGTYTWTAPTGVTNISVLQGSGGSGTTATAGWYINYTTYSPVTLRRTGTVSYTTSMPASGTVPTTLVSNSLESNPTNIEWFNAGSWGPLPLGYYTTAGPYSQSSATGIFQGSTLDYSTVRAEAQNIVNTYWGTVTTSTSGATYSNFELPQYYYFNGNVTGGNSTAFGYTFNGGVGVTPPSIGTQLNITVSPGSSYTVVVGANNGAAVSFISITY